MCSRLAMSMEERCYNEGKDQQTICDQLLSDAETGKNGAKHFVRGYLSSDRS